MRVERMTTQARTRWQWPWLHNCWLDRGCRELDVPAFTYVWPLMIRIDFSKEAE